MRPARPLLFIFTLIAFCITSAPSFGFQSSADLLNIGDSLLNTGDDSTKTETDTNHHQSVTSVIGTLENYAIATNHFSKVLERDIDTTLIASSLPLIERRITIIRDRLENQGADINLRYLSALKNFIKNEVENISNWKEVVDNRNHEIQFIYDSLIKIQNDPVIYPEAYDSILLPAINVQLQGLQDRIQKVDSLYYSKQLNLADFQSRISKAQIDIDDFRDEINQLEGSIEAKLFDKEVNYIWDPTSYSKEKDLPHIIRRSYTINKIIFQGYMAANIPTFLLTTLIAILTFVWLKYLIRRIKDEKEFADLILKRTKFVPSNPIFSTLLIILPITPFLYHSPPIVLNVILLILMILATTVLITPIVNKKAYTYWMIFSFIFLIYSVSNLYSEKAYEERWALLALSIVSISLAYNIIKNIKGSNFTHPNQIIFLIRVFLIIQGASLISNIFGRYSLAKILGIAATTSLLQALGLYVFVLVIMEAIYLQIEVGKKSSKEYTAYFDFQEIQNKIQKIFIFFATAIWLFYLTKNLIIYNYLYNIISEFLSIERTIGNTNFTFGSILIFLLVIWFSSIIARYLTYYFEAKDQKVATNRKQRLGSSVLLIKLAVFTVGFLFAVTAAGIPLDNIAIVLGALSVGIGFGLQTIINNLVSGIILAFERPIQIGDAIEVGGRSGVVKDVGIRASKIQAYDGSEIILPNGDLLSQHLINWTLSNKQRRIELIIGVAYGSDSDKVESILRNILDREGIMKTPSPNVYLQTFADSAVEYRLLFWVHDFDVWVDMRAEVMKEIYKAFAEENIEIPFPQRDLYIKSIPQAWQSPSRNNKPSGDNEKKDEN
ncbi:mechanosensitive ion channel [Echinicola marina]|uniref:mechanosensitive ion channel family protein n=1 Tax=Echinicola marina TaxID=2859768 RepID=UPI001CF6D439|nr:mechanosensitive ion channel domain-containing protein [Echinicola marina]UCS93938.1 mechanosensitive ion channel [Echinicola marina]